MRATEHMRWKFINNLEQNSANAENGLCVCTRCLCRMTFGINSLPALAVMTADSTHRCVNLFPE